jgi:hypothetical protein
MKKLFLSALVIGMFSILNAQTAQTSMAPTQQPANKNMLKDHVCTAACKNGKHVYAHGEKGHVCTDACKKKTM